MKKILVSIFAVLLVLGGVTVVADIQQSDSHEAGPGGGGGGGNRNYFS